MKLRTDPACFSAFLVATVAALAPLPSASGQFATGFESPTYVSGEINGQDTWTVSTNTATARVLTASEISNELTAVGLDPAMPVHSGNQALVVSGAGDGNATIRVVTGLEAERFVTLDVWARPLTGGNIGGPIGNIFLTLEDSAGVRAAAFRFGTPNAGPQTIDYAPPWRNSGLSWDPSTWYRLTMSLDYVAKTYDFDVNGTRVSSSIPFYNTASVNFSQIRIFRGQNQAGMIVDDLMVVPEPATIAALLGGTAILFHRRRKR